MSRPRHFALALAVASAAVGLAVGSAAHAAPITCPSGQTAVKTSNNTWTCINNGGNDTGAGRHKGNGQKP